MAKILTSLKSGVRGAVDPLGRALYRAGVSPDAVTLLGTAGVLVGVGFAVRGHLMAATFIVTVSCLTDVVDGSIARARGYGSRFGALLDSTMDRVADGAIFGGVAWYLGTRGDRWGAAAALICLVGGQVVSYVKARAEGLGLDADVGIAERLERLIIVGVGGLLWGFGLKWGLAAALWLLAALSVITAGQRLLHARRDDRARSQDRASA
jgi:CDP-diacylglycerol--glycerol-3-phosphate 3-phosphatidyltransferase